MSFVRPEAMRHFRRWAETAAYAGVTAFGVWWLLSAVADPLWRWGLAGFAALVGVWLIRAAALAALAEGDGHAPGIVEIDERRVAYWGPHGGGVAALDEIASIDVIVRDEWDPYDETSWALRPPYDKEALIIPVSATGAEKMIDAFAALPGFSPARALSALRSATPAMITVWSRKSAPERPSLASRLRDL